MLICASNRRMLDKNHPCASMEANGVRAAEQKKPTQEEDGDGEREREKGGEVVSYLVGARWRCS